MSAQVAIPSSSRGSGLGATKDTNVSEKKKGKAPAIDPDASEDTHVSEKKKGKAPAIDPDASANTNVSEKKKGKAPAVDPDDKDVELVVRSDDDYHPQFQDEDEDSSETSGSDDSLADPNEDATLRQTKKKEKRREKDLLYQDPVKKAEHRAATKARRRQRDQRDRAELLNEGIKGYTEARKTKVPPPARPEKIQKIWRGLYPTVKSWWRESDSKSMSVAHQTQFRQAERKVDDYINSVMKSPEQKAAYERYLARWPKKEKSEKQALRQQNPQASEETIKNKLLHAEAKFREEIEEAKGLPSDEFYEREEQRRETQLQSVTSEKAKTVLQNKLKKTKRNRKDSSIQLETIVRSVLIFIEKLSDMGISLSSVLSPATRTEFQNFIESSKHHKELYEKLKTELEEPTLEQIDAWGLAARPVFDLVKMVRDDSVQSEEIIGAVKNHLATIKIHNSTLQASNKESGITEDVNCVPIAILEEMVGQWENGEQGQVQENFGKLLEQLRTVEGPAKATLTALEEDEAPDDVADSAGSGPDADNVAGSADPAPDAAPRTETSASIQRPFGEASHRTGENLLDLDIDSMSLDNDRVEAFAYGNGETEFGPLVATRASISDNPRFNRFIIDAGIGEGKWEYFRVIKGSDLGPGGAESMPQDKEVNFNLKDRKKGLKNNPLKEIGPCVVMPRAEGYVSRPGTKQRQPDTYVRVTYTGIDQADWLSKTEFIQLAGKKYAERQLATMIPAYYKRQQYFEACKAQRRHPKTKLPLTSEDFESFPWLFPDNERIIKREEEKDDMDVDEDDEPTFGHVNVNIGDIPDVGPSDPSKKRRAALPESVGSDEEL